MSACSYKCVCVCFGWKGHTRPAHAAHRHPTLPDTQHLHQDERSRSSLSICCAVSWRRAEPWETKAEYSHQHKPWHSIHNVSCSKNNSHDAFSTLMQWAHWPLWFILILYPHFHSVGVSCYTLECLLSRKCRSWWWNLMVKLKKKYQDTVLTWDLYFQKTSNDKAYDKNKIHISSSQTVTPVEM